MHAKAAAWYTCCHYCYCYMVQGKPKHPVKEPTITSWFPRVWAAPTPESMLPATATHLSTVCQHLAEDIFVDVRLVQQLLLRVSIIPLHLRHAQHKHRSNTQLQCAVAAP